MNALKKSETKTVKPNVSLELVQIEATKKIGFIERWMKIFKPSDFSQRDWERIEMRHHATSRGDDAAQRYFANKRGGL